MYQINEISLEHINRLTDIQLTQLLYRLLFLEAEKYRLEDWDGNVPFNITTADAGSDGCIFWKGSPERTPWIPNKFTIFQNKATNLSAKECFEEIMEPSKAEQSKRKLKKQVEKLVLAKGCYILFINKQLVDQGKDERVNKFREAIKQAGHENYDTFQIKIYDSNKIKDWVNTYIGAVILVQKFNDISRPFGFIDWEKWENIIQARENEFQTDETVIANISLIQNSITSEKVIRIAGHSGLGKRICRTSVC